MDSIDHVVVEELMKHPIRKHLLQARIQKQEILKRSSTPKNFALQTLQPIPHTETTGPSFSFAPSRKSTSPTQLDKWWEKKPTLAGEGCREVHHKLSNVNNFSGYYKRRFEPNFEPNDRPADAVKLLLDVSIHEQTIPQRSADFNTELHWRMQLRPMQR